MLATLEAAENQLMGVIDLSGKPDLISVDLTENPNLLCVQVDNVSEANARVGIYADWSVDITTVFSNNCSAMFPGQ